jgi:uncharacterized membrane protein
MNLVDLLPLIILVVILGALLRSNRGTSSDSSGAAERDDPRNWVGPIYRNARDPDLFVPKRFGIGRTVNIAKPLGKVIILGPMILALLLFIVRHR